MDASFSLNYNSVETILLKSNPVCYDLPVYIEVFNKTIKIPVISIFKRKPYTSNKDTDCNPVLYALKHEHGYEFSKSDNKKRNSELKASLLYLGYGVTDIHRNYIEEDSYKEGAEESFFVVNKNNDPKFFDTIFKLSEYYNQDSFLYKDVNDKNAYLIGTNASYFPGYKNKIKQGPIRFIAGKYMSHIKMQNLVLRNLILKLFKIKKIFLLMEINNYFIIAKRRITREKQIK